MKRLGVLNHWPVTLVVAVKVALVLWLLLSLAPIGRAVTAERYFFVLFMGWYVLPDLLQLAYLVWRRQTTGHEDVGLEIVATLLTVGSVLVGLSVALMAFGPFRGGTVLLLLPLLQGGAFLCVCVVRRRAGSFPSVP